jgi:hypothetical protein
MSALGGVGLLLTGASEDRAFTALTGNLDEHSVVL